MTTTPFDVNELLVASEKAPKPTNPIFIKATDGIQLAVRVYSPPSPKAILVFYHGGGAHSGAGYHILAHELSWTYNIKVYTPDIRGHGQSEGPRGDSPTVEQIHKDIDNVLEYARTESDNNVPLFCGGHSSGGGLIIQYATKYSKSKYQNDINGYLLLSPQLGPNSNVDRNDNTPGFCKVSVLPFILNGIFGIMGHYPAVQFQYSEKVLNESGNIPYNTVNMANAISPTEPSKQLQEMSEDNNNNIHLWIGQDDELFDSEKVQKLYEHTTIVKGGTHLGILVNAHNLLGPWLGEHIQE
mmetsp:Transcript_135336/g.191470  ORF Transcript_135336/g.191470 Transcript_135336/m.191470 type:complete len:298 (+) Transcript_135336:48-941(+)